MPLYCLSKEGGCDPWPSFPVLVPHLLFPTLRFSVPPINPFPKWKLQQSWAPGIPVTLGRTVYLSSAPLILNSVINHLATFGSSKVGRGRGSKIYIICWSFLICLDWKRLVNMEPLCCITPGSTIHTVVYVNGAPKAKLDYNANGANRDSEIWWPCAYW